MKCFFKLSKAAPGQTADSQVNASFRVAFILRFVCPPTCVDLRWLALTLVELNSRANPRKFFIVWPPNASRHKLIVSHLYMSGIYNFLRLAWASEPTCESVWPPFASPYASSGFANLHRLVSPFGLLVSRSGRTTPCARTSVTVIQGTPHFDLRPISLTTLCGITSVLGIGY